MSNADTSRNSLTRSLIHTSAVADIANKRAESANTSALGLLAVVATYKAEIEDLKLSLLIQKAQSAGLRAQISGFIASHPDGPERKYSGKFFNDGEEKKIGRIRYENAFDDFLQSNNIENPKQYRID